MKRRTVLGILAGCLMIPLSTHAQPPDHEWLVGTWEGALGDVAVNANRTLRILSVDVDGKAQGTWFVTGRDEYLANISVREGSKVRIISFANSVVELSRQGESELVGSFARVNGRTSPVVLKKTNGSSDAVGANLAKALVRHWEGDIRYISITSADPRRTLYIDSVIQKDGQWIASGRYGITGRSLGRVSIEVGTTGNRPWIRFATGAHSIVRLQMVGDRHMSGSIKFKGTGWGDSEHIEPALRLERID